MPTLKAAIIHTFAAMGLEEPLTSDELASGLYAAKFDFGPAAVNHEQRVMLVEKVLARLKIDGTLATRTAGEHRYWWMAAAVPANSDPDPDPGQRAPVPVPLPVRPSSRTAGRPLDDSGEHLLDEPTPQANRFALLFTAAVLVAIGVAMAIAVAMTPSQFSPRGENYDPAHPDVPTTTPTPPTHTVEDSSLLPPDFVADTMQPPATGTDDCATVYGHSLDGTKWVAPYCGTPPQQP